jgi:hypothetical protein
VFPASIGHFTEKIGHFSENQLVTSLKVRLKILFLFNYKDILQATKKSLLHLQVQRKGIRYRKTPKKDKAKDEIDCLLPQLS